MSGFPPPPPTKKSPDNVWISPFSLDETSEDEKTQQSKQTGSAKQNTQGSQSDSTSAQPKGPWLRSKPSQALLSSPAPADTKNPEDHEPINHTPPKLSPRGNSSRPDQATTPPADSPPPPPLSSLEATQTNAHPGFSTGSPPSANAQQAGGGAAIRASSTTTTTTTNTTTTTTTTTTTATSKNSRKDESHDYLIPELGGVMGKRIIGHALLAKQLVQAESRGYVTPLKGAKIDALLRGKVWLKEEFTEEGKTITQTDDQNAITRFCEPFMKHYFDTPLMEKNLNQVTKNYKQQAAEANKLYQELGVQGFNRSEKVQELMKPVIAPVVDYICGPDNDIQSSKMPAPVLAAMLSLDEEIQAWYEKNGGNDAAELLLARKNALTGIFGVRAFAPNYAIDLSSDQEVPQGYYRPLTGFLITYLNKHLDKFLDTVINCPKGQRELIKREALIAESRPVLPKSELEKIDHAKERFQSRKPSSLLIRLKDAVEGIGNKAEKSEMTSPRRELKRQETVSKGTHPPDDKDPKSPRSAEERKKILGEENAEAREIKKARDRQAVLNQYLKNMKLNSINNFIELGDILRGFKQKIVDASSGDYKKFKENPDLVFHKFLENFIAQTQGKGTQPSSALQKFYLELSNKLGIDDSE